ncbi:M48 family metallopeptidase [Haloarchaeobius sp. HME9146]|uniref:M48 metallopeptidase family protein n=1 Tax=Haloarchaeobius sp. HME9146 TaxID=2978732 RepID=UPI0021BEE109|nr:M48 family metallopeptidase [Haloarchaeobius sp. HME9146]
MHPAQTTARSADHRWGEYHDDVVSLHWRLILAPKRIQDYVLAHELAHAKYGDHSESFWNTVGTLIPDYQDRRESVVLMPQAFLCERDVSR